MAWALSVILLYRNTASTQGQRNKPQVQLLEDRVAQRLKKVSRPQKSIVLDDCLLLGLRGQHPVRGLLFTTKVLGRAVHRRQL